MKQRLIDNALLLFFLLLLLYSSESSPRSLAAKIEKGEAELNEINSEDSLLQQLVGNDQLMNQLMGLEVCDGGDEECIKRRIVSEAHLDYIYTQQQKP